MEQKNKSFCTGIFDVDGRLLAGRSSGSLEKAAYSLLHNAFCPPKRIVLGQDKPNQLVATTLFLHKLTRLETPWNSEP